MDNIKTPAPHDGGGDVKMLKAHTVTPTKPKLKPKTKATRCVAMPSVMATHWVGQNFGPIFHRLWTKIQIIKFPCA